MSGSGFAFTSIGKTKKEPVSKKAAENPAAFRLAERN
jgi:hypothetical protein